MKGIVKTISEMTGLSQATVSNALHHKRNVSQATIERVEKIARDLGHNTSASITKVKFLIFKKNGLIVDDTPFFQLLASGAQQECSQLGMEMIMSTIDKRDPNYDDQVRWLQNDTDTGVILLGNEMMSEDLPLIQGMRCPLVVIDYKSDTLSFDSVMSSNLASAKTAVEYLLSKGHREIGYIGGNFRIAPFRERYQGFCQALYKAKLTPEKKYTVTVSTTMHDAYLDMKRYLGKHPALPTAYFVDNDIIALGIMKALSEHGLRIPQDISLIGYDDLPYSAVSSPALTTIKVPKEYVGRVAARRLNDIMKRNERDVHLQIQVCTSFVERESVAQR